MTQEATKGPQQTADIYAIPATFLGRLMRGFKRHEDKEHAYMEHSEFVVRRETEALMRWPVG